MASDEIDLLQNENYRTMASETVHHQQAIAQALIGISLLAGSGAMSAPALVTEPKLPYLVIGGAMLLSSLYLYAKSGFTSRSPEVFSVEEFGPEDIIGQRPSVEELQQANELARSGYAWSIAAPFLLASAVGAPALTALGVPPIVSIPAAFALLILAGGATAKGVEGLYKSINIFGNQEGRLYYYLTEVPGFNRLVQHKKDQNKSE